MFFNSMKKREKILTILTMVPLPLFCIYIFCNLQMFNSSNGIIVILLSLALRGVLFAVGIKSISTGKTNYIIILVLASINAGFVTLTFFSSIAMIPLLQSITPAQTLLLASMILLVDAIYFVVIIVLAFLERKQQGQNFPVNNHVDYYRGNYSAINRCQNCGAEVSEYANFCRCCGAEIKR